MSPTSTRHQRRRTRGRAATRRLTLSPTAQIYAAIPHGYKRARNQPAALKAFEARISLEADLGHLRADAERNALTIARAVVFAADWRTMTLWPGWNTLQERTGLKRTSIGKYLALFHTWGLLGRVRSGSTHRTRGHQQGDTDGNLAGEYVLCVPADQEPVEETRTPSLLRKEERGTAGERTTRTRTRERETATWPIHQTPETRGQQRDATQRLRQQVPLLAKLRSKRLTDLLAPWFELEWSPAQIRHALDHRPDGTPHWHTADVRHVAGWLKYRLGLWRDTTPPAQLGAGQSTDLTAGDVAELPRADAEPVTDTAAHASLARRLLAATTRRSDKKPRRGLGVSLPDRDGQLATAEEAHGWNTAETGRGSSDWLLRNAARRAEPDLMRAFGGLGAIA